MLKFLALLSVTLWLPSANCYFPPWFRSGGGPHSRDDNSVVERPNPSNLGCFLCTQLLSVTKHRVGLSQNQLRAVLYEKCRMLPSVFREQCFTFVEASLPEIYFSLNYDFSTKDVCVRLNLCDENNPFSIAVLPPDLTTLSPDLPPPPPTAERMVVRPDPDTLFPPIEPELEKPTISPEMQYELERERQIKADLERERERERSTTRGEDPAADRNDRIGHRNVLPGELPLSLSTRRPLPPQPQTAPIHVVVPEEEIEVPIEISRPKPTGIENTVDDKRVTCAFCERMLENARNYAVTSKTDITAFANTACAALPKGRQADQCYQLADKKIADLAKFVDQQVVEALWCAELNQC